MRRPTPDAEFCHCYQCGASGPNNDPHGLLWDAVSRAVHDKLEPPEPIPATLESADAEPPEPMEYGRMPWRLQIAAMMSASAVPEQAHNADDSAMLGWADALIAAHHATKKGGAA